MHNLRIAMLAPFGIRPKGTLLARMLPLAQALRHRGHQITIVAPPVQNPQDAGQRVTLEGVPVIHTPLPNWLGPAAVVQQVALLLREALAMQPDLLHLFKPKGYSGLAALVARATHPGLPLVVDTDDWEGWGGWNDLLPYPRPAKSLFAWQERDLPWRAAAVTVASRTLETQVWGFGVPPERVVYLPNGIATMGTLPLDQRPATPPTMLLYTRFWEFHVRDLITVLVAIVNRCPAARLLVVGRGERGEETELLQLAQQAGLAAAIDYRGWVEPTEIPALIAAADLALVPMDDTLINRARCSAKLLELMAAGKALVAGNVGQVGEYIEHGQSGLLVPASDPAAMARAALRLLDDSALRLCIGQAARERVARHFTWDILAPRAEEAYRIALTQR